MKTSQLIEQLVYHFGTDTDFGPGRTRKSVGLAFLVGRGVWPGLASDIVADWIESHPAK